MFSRCLFSYVPRAEQCTPKTPTGGGDWHGTKRDVCPKLVYIYQKKFGTTTKCSSLKGLRTISKQTCQMLLTFLARKESPLVSTESGTVHVQCVWQQVRVVDSRQANSFVLLSADRSSDLAAKDTERHYTILLRPERCYGYLNQHCSLPLPFVVCHEPHLHHPPWLNVAILFLCPTGSNTNPQRPHWDPPSQAPTSTQPRRTRRQTPLSSLQGQLRRATPLSISRRYLKGRLGTPGDTWYPRDRVGRTLWVCSVPVRPSLRYPIPTERLKQSTRKLTSIDWLIDLLIRDQYWLMELFVCSVVWMKSFLRCLSFCLDRERLFYVNQGRNSAGGVFFGCAGEREMWTCEIGSCEREMWKTWNV